MATLFLVHGFTGSGKTTFSKKLAVAENAVRFSADEWMSHLYGNNPPEELFADFETRIKELIWPLASEFLKRGQSVILDYGFWQRDMRDKYKKMAADCKVRCVLYAMSADYETCKERVLKRTEDMPEGEIFIDENAIKMFWQRFEPVGPDEGAVIV